MTATGLLGVIAATLVFLFLLAMPALAWQAIFAVGVVTVLYAVYVNLTDRRPRIDRDM